MAEQHITERIAISPSGGGIRIWVGDRIRLHLTWDQARQLHVLLTDALPETRVKADR